jgi:hypothetical protein
MKLKYTTILPKRPRHHPKNIHYNSLKNVQKIPSKNIKTYQTKMIFSDFFFFFFVEEIKVRMKSFFI